jgi:hypothetical protein
LAFVAVDVLSCVITGNDNGKYLGYNMPSACPNAIAVTSMTSSDTPSSFSNLAYTNSPPAVKAKTIAAPGSNIYSTYPGGYQTLSGGRPGSCKLFANQFVHNADSYNKE